MSNFGLEGHPYPTLEIVAPSPLICGGTKLTTQSIYYVPTTTISTLSVLSPSWQGGLYYPHVINGGPDPDEAQLEWGHGGLSCALWGSPRTNICCLSFLLTLQNKVVAYITVSYLWLFRSLNSHQHFCSVTSVLQEPFLSLCPNSLLAGSLLIYLLKWLSPCPKEDLELLVACLNMCPSLYGPLRMWVSQKWCLCVWNTARQKIFTLSGAWISRVTLIY